MSTATSGEHQMTTENVALVALEKQVALAFAAADALEQERIHRVEMYEQAERTAIGNRVAEGEQRLREHIAAQYTQIENALTAAHRAIDKAEGEARSHVAKVDQDLREHIGAQVGQIEAALKAAQRETGIATTAQEKAVKLALDAQKEQATAHNGLIRKMEKQGESLTTRDTFDAAKEASDRRFGKLESWQAKVSGGMMLLGAIGVANLVKLWA